MASKYRYIALKCQYLWSKYQYLGSKYWYIASKYRHLASKYWYLTSKYRYLSSKYQYLASKYQYLASKCRYLASKYQYLAIRYRYLASRRDGPSLIEKSMKLTILPLQKGWLLPVRKINENDHFATPEGIAPHCYKNKWKSRFCHSRRDSDDVFTLNL